MMEDVNQKDIEINFAHLIKSASELENENNNTLRQIESKESGILLLEFELQRKEQVLREKYDEVRKVEEELKKLEAQQYTVEEKLNNLQPMTSNLQSIITEKQMNLKQVKERREKMKQQQETVLNTNKQKWESYYNFFESMPEAQNYLRLKSELVIAEEELKSLKKSRQDLEEENTTVDKDCVNEFYEKISKIAELKCETFRGEKMIRDIIDSNKPIQATPPVADEKHNKEEDIANITNSQSTFPTLLRSNFPAAPVIRSPAPAKELGIFKVPSRASDNLQNDNAESGSRVNKFWSPGIEEDARRSNVSNVDQTYPSEIFTGSTMSNSYVATPQFRTTPDAFSQENQFNPTFDSGLNDAPQAFSFDCWNTPSSTVADNNDFNFNFGESPMNFGNSNSNFESGVIRFQNTPEEPNNSSGFFHLNEQI